MDELRRSLTEQKYRLPYHWMRDPLELYSLPYFGYMRLVLDELPSAPCKVLDAGCGDGRITAELDKAGYEVVGLELIEQQLEYARALVPNATFWQADLREPLAVQTGMQPGSFDACLHVEVYEHIPPEDARRVLRNIHQMLKPEGTLILSVPSLHLPMSNLHYRHFSESDIRQEVSEEGFSIRSIIKQHSLDALSLLCFSKALDRALQNAVADLRILRKFRKRFYMKFLNRAQSSKRFGRYIVVAEKA